MIPMRSEQPVTNGLVEEQQRLAECMQYILRSIMLQQDPKGPYPLSSPHGSTPRTSTRVSADYPARPHAHVGTAWDIAM